eukprot:150919_1
MANQVAQREIAHKQRIVEQNSNSTFSKIILPSFKDIWDFQNSYQGVDALDGLRQASVALSREFSLISECYKQRGNAPSTAIRIYTLQSFVYAALNEALREDKPEILKLFAPYIYQLVHGLNYEKNYYGTVYRGINLPKHCIDQYEQDVVFFWPGFTSSTQTKQVAQGWMGSNCVFEIIIPKRFSYSCANIDHLSAFPTEKEVLIQPYSCYRVLNNQYNKQLKKHIIQLMIEATCYNLSGIWCCDDTEHNVNNAGVYFIAQYGQNVYWFGKKDEAGWDFANVAYGTISNDTDEKDNESNQNNKSDVLSITWCDLPIANDKFCGELKLKVSSDYQKMSKMYDSSNMFWGNEWKKKSNVYLDAFELNIDKMKWKCNDQLSGVWKGSNCGGIYIVATTQINNTQHICWIGYDKNFIWAHVAFGIIENNKRIKVDWGDLLIGMDRYHGKLECLIESNTKIVMKKSVPAGIFFTKELIKIK